MSLVDLVPVPIKAKIDTGARTSAIHAFNLVLTEEGEHTIASFEVHPTQRSTDHNTLVRLPIAGHRAVRSSNGSVEDRPVVEVEARIGSTTFPIELTLTSRDEMGFRLLIGRSALRRRFVVDPAKSFNQGKLH